MRPTDFTEATDAASPKTPQAIDRGSNLVAPGAGEIARVMTSSTKGVEHVQTVVIEQRVEFVQDSSKRLVRSHQVLARIVDGEPDRAGLARVDEL